MHAHAMRLESAVRGCLAAAVHLHAFTIRNRIPTQPNDLTNTLSNEIVQYRAALARTVGGEPAPDRRGRGRCHAETRYRRRDQLWEGAGHVPGAAVARCSKLAARWNCFVPYSRGGSSSSSLSLPPSLWDGNAAAASLAIA